MHAMAHVKGSAAAVDAVDVTVDVMANVAVVAVPHAMLAVKASVLAVPMAAPTCVAKAA